MSMFFSAVLLLFAAACTNAGRTDVSPAVQELLDKAAIQELVVEYYSQLGTGGKGFGDYYVEDSVLDVDGRVAKGREEIENLYKMAGEGEDAPSALGGTFRMTLANILINVNGDSASGSMIWIGIHAAGPKALPSIIEHGRENDEFIKRNGKWYFKHRMITSDSGLSGIFVESYIQR